MTKGNKKMDYSVIRRVDNLGRVVLPKDMRGFLDIHPQDFIELAVTREGIMLKKRFMKKEERQNGEEV